MVGTIQLVQGLLTNFPDVLAEASSYFSQGGEDIVIDYLLSKETEKGIFLDVGAYHPFRFSNTMLLYLKGWRGVNVDGNPQAIESFKKYRSDEVNLHALVSDTAEEVQFFRFQEGAWNTTDPKIMQMLVDRGRPETALVETSTVTTTPISSILDTYIGSRKFDLFNLDVEGLDEKILRGVDFSRYRPKVLTIETSIEEWTGGWLYDFVKSIRYRPISQCLNTAIFVRDD